MWLERLQALAQGNIWQGRQEGEVKVNERLLSQLVSQGFDRCRLQRSGLMFDFISDVNPDVSSSQICCAKGSDQNEKR